MRNGTAVFENNGVTITAESEDAYTDYTSENAKLTETEASTLEAKIDAAILSEMIGG